MAISLSMEGSPLRIDLFESSSILSQLKKFPIYLLDNWNQRIGQILETVIGSLPPQSSDTLSYLFQLQQVEIVLQNALHSQKGDIALKLREHMRMRITDFCAFLKFKKHIAITNSLWERAHQKIPDQHSNDLTRQLIDFQLVSIKNLKDGPLRTALSRALMRLTRQFNSGNLITPICFMDSIEDVFEEQGLIKLPENQHYLVNVHGHARAWMKHPTVEPIRIQNPANKSDKAWILKGYEPWEHYRSVNLPLFESQVDGMFADSPMTGYRI